MQWIDSGDLMKLRFLHGFRKLISSHLCVCVYRELYYLSFVAWKIRYLQYYCQFNRVYRTIRRCVSMLYICKSYSKSTLTSHYEPDLNTVHHDFSCLFAQSVWFTWKICRCYMLKKGEKASLWQHTYFTLSFVMLSEKKQQKNVKQIFLLPRVMCRCQIYTEFTINIGVIASALCYVNMHVLKLMYGYSQTISVKSIFYFGIHCLRTKPNSFRNVCISFSLSSLVRVLNLYSIYGNICVNL